VRRHLRGGRARWRRRRRLGGMRARFGGQESARASGRLRGKESGGAGRIDSPATVRLRPIRRVRSLYLTPWTRFPHHRPSSPSVQASSRRLRPPARRRPWSSRAPPPRRAATAGELHASPASLPLAPPLGNPKVRSARPLLLSPLLGCSFLSSCSVRLENT